MTDNRLQMFAAQPERRTFMKLAAALAVGACAPAASELGSAAAASRRRLHKPEEAGLISAGIEDVRRTIDRLIADNVIPGAVSMIVRRGKLIWDEAQGIRDPVAGTAMRRDDIFRIMSSTKVVTAVATLMMMEEGRLSLDDKVSRFIPSFVSPRVAVAPPGATDRSQVRLVPAVREITIRDLLTHTSGLIADASGGAAHLLDDFDMPPKRPLAEYVNSLGSAALDFQPGTRWQYSPLAGMDTLMRIVEITSRTPADIFLRDRLFTPLEMEDTFFEVPRRKQERVVNLYQFQEGRWQETADWLPRPPIHPYISGAAGLFSTVRDFMQFKLMLLNKGSHDGRQYLRPETVELMATNQVGDLFDRWLPPITAGYGFGLGVRTVEDSSGAAAGRPVGAFGWPGAYGTDAFAAPSEDLAAVIFIQIQPINFSVGTAFGGAIGRALAMAR